MAALAKVRYAGAPCENGSDAMATPAPNPLEAKLVEAKAEAAKYRRLSENQRRTMAACERLLRPYLNGD